MTWHSWARATKQISLIHSCVSLSDDLAFVKGIMKTWTMTSRTLAPTQQQAHMQRTTQTTTSTQNKCKEELEHTQTHCTWHVFLFLAIDRAEVLLVLGVPTAESWNSHNASEEELHQEGVRWRRRDAWRMSSVSSPNTGTRPMWASVDDFVAATLGLASPQDRTCFIFMFLCLFLFVYS